MAGTFVGIEFVVEIVLAAFASKLAAHLTSGTGMRMFNRATGGVFVAGGGVLADARASSLKAVIFFPAAFLPQFYDQVDPGRRGTHSYFAKSQRESGLHDCPQFLAMAAAASGVQRDPASGRDVKSMLAAFASKRRCTSHSERHAVMRMFQPSAHATGGVFARAGLGAYRSMGRWSRSSLYSEAVSVVASRTSSSPQPQRPRDPQDHCCVCVPVAGRTINLEDPNTWSWRLAPKDSSVAFD